MGQVQNDLCVYKERFGYKHTKWRDHVIKKEEGWLSTSTGERLQKKSTLLMNCSQTSSFQNGEKIPACCLRQPVSCILLWQF